MTANPFGSVLAADFGSVTTRVVLFDVVDGIYRLVARAEGHTTAGYPVNDVGVGLDRLLREINEATGRNFTSTNGRVITPEQPDRSGVDYFLTTASAGRPMKAVLVGLAPNISILSALRVISGSYVQPVATISLDDARTEEERLNAILLARPDLVFIAGGTENGAREPVLELAKTARLAVDLTDKRHKPVVLYGGNSALAGQIEDMFKDITTLHQVDNIRPDATVEEVETARRALGVIFNEYKGSHSDDFASVMRSSSSGVLPTAGGYDLIVSYLSNVRGDDVLSIDVGSSAVILTDSVGGQVETSIRTDLGLGHSAANLLEAAGVDALRKWLPFYFQSGELVNYAQNKMLRPGSIPMTQRDLFLEHAMLRAGVRTAVDEAHPEWNETLPDVGLIIGAGSPLTGTGNPGFTAMLLLDALQPSGPVELQIDPYGVIPALGALALVNPQAVVQILEEHAFEYLGMSFSVSGRPKVDKPALKIRITEEDGTKVNHTVNGGHLWIYPLQPGKRATVDVRTSGGASLGGRGRIKQKVQGGTAGIVFDARGRALPLAKDVPALAAQLMLWISEATGDPQQEIPARWLEPIAEPKLAEAAAAVAARKTQEVKAQKKRGKKEEPTLDERLGTTEMAAADEDDEFMRLIEQDDEDEDELGALRDVLS